jgi:hypothetical protein
MKMRKPSPAQIGLLLAAALLTALLLHELTASPPSFAKAGSEIAGSVATPAAAAAAQDGLALPPIQDFAETDARPLFSPLRRPPRAEAGNMAAAPPPMNVALIGIIMGPEERIAIVRTPSSPTTVNARIGKTLDGWELVEIEADHVVLKSGSTEQEVRLRQNGQGQP